jgi:hypothetical protein
MTTLEAPRGYLHYFVRYKARIALTYGLCIAGAVCLFLYPYATGIAIDGALARDPWAIMPLALIWAAHLAIDGFRQVFDTRTFTRVFAEAATDMVTAQKQDGKTTSEVAARVNMMEEFTWFMGSSLPELLISVISPLGALAVLFTLSVPAAVATSILIIAVIAFNSSLFPMIKSRQVDLNSLSEVSVKHIESNDAKLINDHYHAIGKAFIRISDLNAVSWMSAQALGICVLAFSIWQAGAIGGITAGGAYTLVNYVWRVMEGAFSVPSYAHQFARLTDIWRRINEGN